MIKKLLPFFFFVSICYSQTVPISLDYTSFGWQCGPGLSTNCLNLTGTTTPSWPTGKTPFIMNLWDTHTEWSRIMTGYSGGVGTYDWTELDGYLDQLAVHQNPVQNAMYTIGWTPSFTGATGCGSGPTPAACSGPPADLTSTGSPTFNQFITDLTSHCSAAGHCFRYYINYVQLWNEFNDTARWSGTVQQLYWLMKPAVAIIKANVPNVLIISPPSSKASGFQAKQNAWATQEGSNGMISDYWGIHAYGTAGTEFESLLATISNELCTNTGTGCLKPTGWVTKPVMMTETNFSAGGYACTTSVDDCKGQVVRWQVLLHSLGIKGIDWYFWKTTIGNSTDLLPAWNWMVTYLNGATVTGQFTNVGNTYSVPLTMKDGALDLMVWSTVAGTSYTVPASYVGYTDMDGNVVTITPGSNITIGVKPFLLTQLACSVPTLGVSGGTYANGQLVSASSSCSQVLLCTDSTNTCTPNLPYASPIYVRQSEYLRTQGTQTGARTSSISSAHYNITNTNCSMSSNFNCYRNDLVTIPEMSIPPLMGPNVCTADNLFGCGNLTGAGTLFNDPQYGTNEYRGTDANTEGLLLNSAFVVAGSGSADEKGHFNCNDDRFIYSDNSGRNFVSQFAFGSPLVPMYLGVGGLTRGFYTTTGMYFGHDCTHPYNLYTFGSGTIGGGSNGTKLVYWDMSNPSTVPSSTLIGDMATSTCIGTSYVATWTANGEADNTDTDFAIGLSNVGGQGTGLDVVIYRKGSGCRRLNISTNLVNGDWGPTGSTTTPICTGSGLHNVKIFGSGGAGGSVIITLNNGTGCPVGGYQWFYNGLTVEQLCPLQCSGHFTEGLTLYVNNPGNPPPGSVYVGKRSNTATSTVTNLTAAAPIDGLPKAVDWHFGWSAGSDTAPFIGTNYLTNGSVAITSGWQKEIVAMRSDIAANPIRLAKTYSNFGQIFGGQQVIGSFSQSGKYYAATTDGRGTFGGTDGAAICYPSGSSWIANTVFGPTSIPYVLPITSTNAGKYTYQAITAGTSSNAHPVWPQSLFATVVDGTVVWQNVGIGNCRTDIVFIELSTGTVLPTASQPTITPTGGVYPGSQTVSITDISLGAVICYNLTGSPATDTVAGCAVGSTLYTGPIVVPTSSTVYAVAGGTGYTDSAVRSAVYIIVPPSGLVFQISGLGSMTGNGNIHQ